MEHSIKSLLARLEDDYPNVATILEDKSEVERERYLAKLELIEYIKLLVKDTK
jgi:HEPN domain-containing protein